MSDIETKRVSLTIDGAPVTVPEGTTVIQAAERAGILVPRYCYHPGIPGRPAQCRVCLVEIEEQPKLLPSCVTDAKDGMIVHTQSPDALEAQRAVIEFLLLNHPLDCPICDAAGQCMLQDYAYETGQLATRLRDAKQVMGRDRVAEDILYFADRCIICTRCVRFMDEVAGDNALIVAQRGHKAYIDTFPGKDLDNPFRGNIVDVCPVGALVHEDFLFKARAWDFDTTPGVCAGCSQGCNIDVNVKENQVVRVKPRYNADVNGYWMCDEGRRHMIMVNRGARADTPLIRRGAELEPATWAEALAWVAEQLPAGAGGIARVSPLEGCESLHALTRLLDHLGIDGGSFAVERGAEATLAGFPQLKLRAERAPNGFGARVFGFEETAAPPEAGPDGTLVVIGDRLLGADPSYGADAGFFLHLATHVEAPAHNASAVLPIAGPGEADGTYMNFEGRIQRFHQAMEPRGVARPAWMVIDRLLGRIAGGEDESGTGWAPLRDVRAAFDAMAEARTEFAGLSWQSLGLKGAPPATALASAAGNGGR